MNLARVLTLSVVLLCSCAHKAKVHKAPDATRVVEAQRKLSTRIVEARDIAKRASVSLSDAKASSTREGQIIETIKPRVQDLLKNAPPDLRPEVEALDADVQHLSTAHTETVTRLGEAEAEHARLSVKHEQVIAARDEVNKLTPEYLGEVEQLAARANAAEAGWSKDSKSLLWYRTRWWGLWIAAGVGLVAAVLFGGLKFFAR